MAQPGGGTGAIELHDVDKTYASGTPRAVRALKHVSLEIRDNEFFTLLGPSGCGKTTLLRLIAGFESPTRGAVHLFGTRLDSLPPHRRPVNTVFQHYALFPHMTVAENVGFGLEMLGRDRVESTCVVADTLALVHMSEFAERTPAQLSGGQQQRIALARALAPHPRVLLLDEPLSALDLKLRRAMRLELKNLQAETGITFVFVTHDQEEALAMSDRLAVMADGEIQQVGTPAAIYREPVNRFVAEFIGETNVIPATVESAGSDAVRCAFDGGVIPVARARGYGPGDRVALVVRPEQIRMSSRCGVLPAGCADGSIRNRVFLGTDMIYQVSLATGLVVTVRVPNTRIDGAHFSTGDDVRLEFVSEAVRVLPM